MRDYVISKQLRESRVSSVILTKQLRLFVSVILNLQGGQQMHRMQIVVARIGFGLGS